MADRFSAMLGGRLRAARRQRGWSLGEVESFTDGEFKASVVGAYERGERAISVQRLVRLAGAYSVEPSSLIPKSPSEEDIVIDLDALEGEAGADIVDRYLAAIRLLRRDGNPNEVRESDKAVMSSLIAAADSPAEVE